MKPLISIVYPTSNRPSFVEMAFQFLQKQSYRNFEVIVSDNFTKEELSCAFINQKEYGFKVKYVKPSTHLSMIENWNYAYQFCEGDYVAYLTDKMFLLPTTLNTLEKVIVNDSPDIVSWSDCFYVGNDFPKYFGNGRLYYLNINSEETSKFDPFVELNKKSMPMTSRNEMTRNDYARGKICFGAYSKRLCEEIITKTGSLFHPLSPDYTSMILGLSMATKCIEMKKTGIVHVNTDISNGGSGALSLMKSIEYLKSCGNFEEIINSLPVPGMYSSTHNCIGVDYKVLKAKYDLKFNFGFVHWLVFIEEDFLFGNRIWPSEEVKNEQKEILEKAIKGLSNEDLILFEKLKKKRTQNRFRRKFKLNIKSTISKITPKKLKSILKKIKTNDNNSQFIILNSLSDIHENLHI